MLYFWKSAPQDVSAPQADLAPEDQAIAQELQDVTTADLEAEFKEIDAALNELASHQNTPSGKGILFIKHSML